VGVGEAHGHADLEGYVGFGHEHGRRAARGLRWR
jgi:hypothetical protein